MQAPERSRKRMAFIECVMIFPLLLMIPCMVQAQQQYKYGGLIRWSVKPIISGVSEPFDRGDLDHMEAAFKNTRWQEKGGV
ncbi:hypothetical protein [Desulfobacca acetoxidans]